MIVEKIEPEESMRIVWVHLCCGLCEGLDLASVPYRNYDRFLKMVGQMKCDDCGMIDWGEAKEKEESVI